MADETDLFPPSSLLNPLPFKREHFKTYLFTPYSLKLHRHVYFYTEDGYDLWVHFESSLNVLQFNERVCAIPLSLSNRKAIVRSPMAASKDKTGRITVHTIARPEEPNSKSSFTISQISDAWKGWCSTNEYDHQEWTKEKLRAQPLLLDNQKRLLRYTSKAGAIRNFSLEESLLRELKLCKKNTFSWLIRQFPSSDSDELKQSLAWLIMDQRIYSDIHIEPFTMLTEISAYHEFTQVQ